MLLVKYKEVYQVLIGLSIVVAFLFLFFLPNQVPMQWGMDGSVNYTLPKGIAVWVLPILTSYLAFRGWNRPDFVYLGSCLAVFITIIGIFTFISIG